MVISARRGEVQLSGSGASTSQSLETVGQKYEVTFRYVVQRSNKYVTLVVYSRSCMVVP